MGEQQPAAGRPGVLSRVLGKRSQYSPLADAILLDDEGLKSSRILGCFGSHVKVVEAKISCHGFSEIYKGEDLRHQGSQDRSDSKPR